MSAITAPRQEPQVAVPAIRNTVRFAPASLSFFGKIGAFIAVFFANIVVICVVTTVAVSLIALELIVAALLFQMLRN